ncbi:MAG: hypothetical protein F4Y37_12305 [Caldilineaceae bacterium SB0664_bin_22]|nr:hypothetical protein [Caldilineaceae bacterium SB0664_bin_22]
MDRFRHLAEHFGTPDTTVIDGTAYGSPDSLPSIKGLRAPNILIAFAPEACARRNAYIIAEQAPPDFVLEVASCSTGHIDG